MVTEEEPSFAIPQPCSSLPISDGRRFQVQTESLTSASNDASSYSEDPFHHHPLKLSDIFSTLSYSLRPVTLKFNNVVYCIKLPMKKGGCLKSNDPKLTRTILNGVSGIVRPGELLAMLGTSGSGKTTLLTAFSGRHLPGKISGKIVYNEKPFSSSIKRNTGFVTQDDVLYPHLTVLETLKYAAILKLPKQLTKSEKVEQAEMIIMELGLTQCRDSVIGGGLLRGISGGERKRVSIGHEMILNPSLLLLDKPTSGLDSTTAQQIIKKLRRLAQGGRTVVTTIHQPPSRLYRMFDKVVVMSDGSLIYSGRADEVVDYFGSIGFELAFTHMNPADFLLDLANGIAPNAQGDELDFNGSLENDGPRSLIKQSLISSYKKNLYPRLKAEMESDCNYSAISKSEESPRRSCGNQWATRWLEEFMVLLRRGLTERRHESYSSLRVVQVMSVSMLSGLLWWQSTTSHLQDQVGLLFFFSIFWGYFPLFNAIFAFPLEQPMLIKERSAGMYHLSSYFFARTVGDLPMELVLPIIFTSITYWMGGLKPSLLTFVQTIFIILFNVLVSQGVGLALGAILMDLKQATTLASVAMLVFLLAGGYYIQHIPLFIAWLKYISFSHYCYRLLVGVQYSATEVYECGCGEFCKIMDFPAIKYLGLDHIWLDLCALSLMLVGYRVLAYLALKMGQPH